MPFSAKSRKETRLKCVIQKYQSSHPFAWAPYLKGGDFWQVNNWQNIFLNVAFSTSQVQWVTSSSYPGISQEQSIIRVGGNTPPSIQFTLCGSSTWILSKQVANKPKGMFESCKTSNRASRLQRIQATLLNKVTLQTSHSMLQKVQIGHAQSPLEETPLEYKTISWKALIGCNSSIMPIKNGQ